MTLGLGLRTRMREVGSSTPASVLHAKSQTLEPTAAVEPSQHCAKVHGGSRRPPAFAAESLEPISCSPTTVSVTVAVQSHVQVQARTAMVRGKQQEASKPLATSPRSAAATRCDAKGPSIVGEGAKTSPLARGRARGGSRSPSAAHASSGWGRSIPADLLDISSSTAGAQRTVSPLTAASQRAVSSSSRPTRLHTTSTSSAGTTWRRALLNSDREYWELLKGNPALCTGPYYYSKPDSDEPTTPDDPEWELFELHTVPFPLFSAVGDGGAAAGGEVEAGPKTVQHSHGLLPLVSMPQTLNATGGDSIYSDDSASDAVAECEVETGVTAPQSDHGSLSEQLMQIAAMSVQVKAE